MVVHVAAARGWRLGAAVDPQARGVASQAQGVQIQHEAWPRSHQGPSARNFPRETGLVLHASLEAARDQSVQVRGLRGCGTFSLGPQGDAARACDDSGKARKAREANKLPEQRKRVQFRGYLDAGTRRPTEGLLPQPKVLPEAELAWEFRPDVIVDVEGSHLQEMSAGWTCERDDAETP